LLESTAAYVAITRHETETNPILFALRIRAHSYERAGRMISEQDNLADIPDWNLPSSHILAMHDEPG
jgi:hypothetical protein